MNLYSAGSLQSRGTPLDLVAAGTVETASTTHSAVDTGYEGGSLYVTVAVTAASGTTPTLTVVVESSQDGTTWTELATVGSNGYAAGSVVGTAPDNFTAAATATAYVPRGQLVRAKSVIAGTTPSFTYGVSAVAC